MKYIIYCRKSSESEEKQVQSIESQKTELLRIAEVNGFTVDQIFEETYSGLWCL